MIVAIPVEEKSMETNVCPSFGRTPYFLIYNPDTQESRFLDNSAIASEGGAGIKAAQTIVDNQAGALLTPRCGENAAAVLKAAKISIFKTVSTSLQETLRAFQEGELNLLEEIHPGFHHHGGR